jgi:hypothetical protein
MTHRMYTRVRRGSAVGAILTPHQYEDGSYVVSNTRFKADYIRVASETELADWLERGYRLRMSNPEVPGHRAPSLIAPRFIEFGVE